MSTITIDRSSLRLSASLLIAGQVLYVLVTLLHTGGEANHHPEIFAAYAASAAWTGVHVAQFACMTILMGLSGLVYLWQGWLAGAEGFSPPHTTAIVLAEVLNVTWMIGLLIAARKSS